MDAAESALSDAALWYAFAQRPQGRGGAKDWAAGDACIFTRNIHDTTRPPCCMLYPCIEPCMSCALHPACIFRPLPQWHRRVGVVYGGMVTMRVD